MPFLLVTEGKGQPPENWWLSSFSLPNPHLGQQIHLLNPETFFMELEVSFSLSTDVYFPLLFSSLSKGSFLRIKFLREEISCGGQKKIS